jgi:hypothetical protein
MDNKHDLKKAQRKVCKEAAKIANKKMREEFLNNSSTQPQGWVDKLSVLSRAHSLIMKFSWNPFRGNHRVKSGLSLELSKIDESTIRNTIKEETESLDRTRQGMIRRRQGQAGPKKLDIQQEVNSKMNQIVNDSITEAIMNDPKDFISALIQDTLTSDKPFYNK